MVKAVIFDVDGTLVDSIDLHAHAWQEAFRHFGYPVDFDALRAQIGKGGDQLIPVFVPKEDLKRRHDAIDAFRHELYMRKYLHQVRGFHRTRALFQRLHHDGKRIALASSAKSDELAYCKRAADIDDLIDAETVLEDIDHSQPSPDILQAALDTLKLKPEEAVAVGGTPWDAKTAAKAGITMIGVLCGGFSEKGLRAAGCREVWRDPDDLLRHYPQSLIVRS